MKKNILVLVILGCLVLPVWAIDKYPKDYTKLYNYVQTFDFQNIEQNDELRAKLLDLYYFQRLRGEWQNAALTINEIVSLCTTLYGENSRPALEARITRAENNTILNVPDKVISEYNEIYNIAVKNGYKDIANSALYGLANFYMQTQQYSKALEYYNKVPKNTELEGMTDADRYLNISRMYTNLSDNKKALQVLNKYYSSLKTPKDYDKYQYNFALAQLYGRKGEFNKAVKYFAKSETLVNKIDEPNKRNTIFLNFYKNILYKDIDNYEEAGKIFKENEYYIEKNDNIAEIQNIYCYSLDYYKDLADEQNFNKIYKKLEKFYENYPSYSLRKILYKEKKVKMLQKLGKTDEAVLLTNQILKELDSVKELVPVDYARILTYAANNSIAADNPKEAREYLDTAYKYYRKSLPENAYDLHYLYNQYAMTYEKEKDYLNAEKYYKKALTYTYKAQNEKDSAFIYTPLAYVYAQMDNKELAKKYIDKAIENSVKCYGVNSSMTYYVLIDKYKLLKNKINDNELALLTLKEINNNIGMNGITGQPNKIKFEVGIINAYEALEKEDYGQAEKYAKEAKQYAYNNKDEKTVNKLFYDIYSKSGNRIKAIKYKKLAHIS